jgi:hypothetical protein
MERTIWRRQKDEEPATGSRALLGFGDPPVDEPVAFVDPDQRSTGWEYAQAFTSPSVASWLTESL